MAVAVDAVTTDTDAGSATVTQSHTVGSGSDRALYVLVSERYQTALTGCTWNSTSMTKVAQFSDTGSNTRSVTVYRLLNPDSGVHDVVVSQSATHVLAITIMSLTGVDQTTPEGTFTHSPDHANSTGQTYSVTDGDTDSLVLGICGWYRPSAVDATKADSGQTEQSLTVSDLGHRTSYSPGGSSVSVGWGFPSAVYWAQLAFAVLASAAGGGGSAGRDLTLLGVG